MWVSLFLFNDTATTELSTLSLHDALPICSAPRPSCRCTTAAMRSSRSTGRSRTRASASSERRATARSGRRRSRRARPSHSSRRVPAFGGVNGVRQQRGSVATAVALGAATLVVLQLVLAGSYWETSEGVYLYTS